MCMLDEIRARGACLGAIRSPEVAKQRAATRSQEAARDEIYAIARAHKILAGEMDKDDVDKIRGWMSIHREELFANWKLLEEDGTYFKIEPLR